MKITRDNDYRQKIIDEQRRLMGHGGGRRTGTHVSDLIFCTRKAWAERQPGIVVPEVEDGTILVWLRGLSHEALLAGDDSIGQVRSGWCFTCQQNWTGDIERDDGYPCRDCGDELLVGTIDWIEIEDGDFVSFDEFIPVEMKSTMKSSRKTLENGDMLWFIDQIKSYMWMHGQPVGRVCVLHNMGDYSRGNPDARSDGPKADLRVYRLEWESDDEAAEWGQSLQRKKSEVEGALLPALGPDSPAHSMICDYCVVGALLPDGSECERFPWTADGFRKGSRSAQLVTVDDINSELDALMKLGEPTND